MRTENRQVFLSSLRPASTSYRFWLASRAPRKFQEWILLHARALGDLGHSFQQGSRRKTDRGLSARPAAQCVLLIAPDASAPI